jgi:hypothetical protein
LLPPGIERQRTARRTFPGLYGNKPKQDVELSGPNGDAMKFENMSEAELDPRLKALLEKYQQEKKT